MIDNIQFLCIFKNIIDYRNLNCCKKLQVYGFCGYSLNNKLLIRGIFLYICLHKRFL